MMHVLYGAHMCEVSASGVLMREHVKILCLSCAKRFISMYLYVKHLASMTLCQNVSALGADK